MKKLVSILFVTVLVMGLASCSGKPEEKAKEDKMTEAKKEETTKVAEEKTEVKEETTEAKEEGGTFTVGFDQDFPPMGFVDDNGEFVGFDIDLAKEAAKRMGKEIVLQPISWDAKDLELKSGNIDCVWNGFTINGREDKYTWSVPYMANNQVIIVKDASIKTFEDLADKIVTVQLDSSGEAALKDSPDLTSTFKELVTAADYNTAFLDLETGAVDAVVIDEIVGRYQIQKRGSDEYSVLEQTLTAEEFGVGFDLGNEALRDEVQAAMIAMSEDGTMAKISQDWFGADVTIIGK